MYKSPRVVSYFCQIWNGVSPGSLSSQLVIVKLLQPGGGGHWPRKGVWWCAALKTPFSRLSCRSQGSHFIISSKRVSSQDPLLRKFGNFSLNSLNFHPNFSSQAPKFGNFQLTSLQIWKFSAHKPPNLKIFHSQAPKFGNFPPTSPPFQRQISVRKPHTLEIRAAHPYLKKVECTPPVGSTFTTDKLILMYVTNLRIIVRICSSHWILDSGPEKNRVQYQTYAMVDNFHTKAMCNIKPLR